MCLSVPSHPWSYPSAAHPVTGTETMDRIMNQNQDQSHQPIRIPPPGKLPPPREVVRRGWKGVRVPVRPKLSPPKLSGVPVRPMLSGDIFPGGCDHTYNIIITKAIDISSHELPVFLRGLVGHPPLQLKCLKGGPTSLQPFFRFS